MPELALVVVFVPVPIGREMVDEFDQEADLRARAHRRRAALLDRRGGAL